MSDQEPQAVFAIEKLYVKDASLEVPNAPNIFLEREAPEIDVQLATQSAPIAEDVYETSLTATVTAKVGDKIMFLVEVTQAGIFRIAQIPAEQLDPVLGIGCPNIVFPYLRETVSDLVNRAGFPPVILNPVNFEALYMQQKQELANGATTH
ncbi:protein-export chaperone SecB [Sulfuriferula nivalis]|uniref:Protein-export protein SecB n=1 Tax=Sulfuriferula nivalis TaxID=2675298 RepID=A0A809RDE6_9PROT|nr:protein-export chaperone SecB [Sulfuriferula nivalis]BBO99788.1 protein-export protein SecB [Sulfuriferula nivalis]